MGGREGGKGKEGGREGEGWRKFSVTVKWDHMIIT